MLNVNHTITTKIVSKQQEDAVDEQNHLKASSTLPSSSVFSLII